MAECGHIHVCNRQIYEVSFEGPAACDPFGANRMTNKLRLCDEPLAECRSLRLVRAR